MSRRSAILSLSRWALVWVLVLSPAGQPAHAADDDLRERLTEREDKRRPVEPWSTEIAGRPLTVDGEYQIDLSYLRRRVIDDAVSQPDRLLLAQELEVEAFYSFGHLLSLFMQLRPKMEEDLLSDTFEEISELAVERGEMWLYSENIADSHVNLDLGRLHFEDDRRWWWDEDLDAVRVVLRPRPSRLRWRSRASSARAAPIPTTLSRITTASSV